MSNQKGFSKVAIIVAVIVLIVAGYFVYNNSKKNKDVNLSDQTNASQSSVKTEESQTLTDEEIPEELTYEENLKLQGWKTYRNEEYGFEVMYPENFEFTSDQSSPGVFVFVILKRKIPVPAECRVELSAYVSIFNKKIVSPSVIAEIEKRHYIDSQSYTTGKIGDKIVSIEKKVSGKCGNGNDITWVEPSGRFVVVFNLSLSEIDLNNEYKNILNQILSTFKFIK